MWFVFYFAVFLIQSEFIAVVVLANVSRTETTEMVTGVEVLIFSLTEGTDLKIFLICLSTCIHSCKVSLPLLHRTIHFHSILYHKPLHDVMNVCIYIYYTNPFKQILTLKKTQYQG